LVGGLHRLARARELPRPVLDVPLALELPPLELEEDRRLHVERARLRREARVLRVDLVEQVADLRGLLEPVELAALGVGLRDAQEAVRPAASRRRDLERDAALRRVLHRKERRVRAGLVAPPELPQAERAATV